jgi:hypothetical protein
MGHSSNQRLSQRQKSKRKIKYSHLPVWVEVLFLGAIAILLGSAVVIAAISLIW